MDHEAIKLAIARRSPAHFAAEIKRRNEKSLTALHKMYAEITSHYEKNGVYKYVVSENIEEGCPHCGLNDEQRFKCSTCLWTKTVDEVEQRYSGYTICCNVEFNGVDHEMVSSGCLSISYAVDYVDVEFYFDDVHVNPGSLKKEYENCIKFLEGHIAWASSEEWGKDYIEDDNDD